VTGFLATLAAAVRNRSEERPGVPFDELEEMARRAAGERRDFPAAVRRARTDSGDFGSLRLLVTLAGADPATDDDFSSLDPARVASAAAEAELPALAVFTEPDLYRGHPEWIESARRDSDRPVLRMDWFLDPRALLEALCGPADALLLDPAFLGRDSLNEALALAREFRATGVVMVRTGADAQTALEENPPAVLLDRRDPENLILRPGITDRLVEALEDYPGVRLVTGGIETETSVIAAARRPIDAVLLSKKVASDERLGDRFAALLRAAEAAPAR
jgi:indole-3-glycerol phosphate synthase